MVRLAAIWERAFLFAIFATLALSTGLAGAVPQGWDAVTGHTAYVTGVLHLEPPETPDRPHLLYGLATHREVRLFGLWATDEPAPESQDRMVFVWSEDSPDPRDGPLVPTGAYARVRDRMGSIWTVYEFEYLSAEARHHAYGVRIGALHQADAEDVGKEGAYNYVLVYKPERLVPMPHRAAVAPAGPQIPADRPDDGLPTDTARPLPALQDTLETVNDLRAADEEDATPQRVQIQVGQGDLPERLREWDPAPRLPTSG